MHKEGCYILLGQNLVVPGKITNFPILELNFRLSLPKIWDRHPNRNFIFEMRKIRGMCCESFKVLSLRYGFVNHLNIGIFSAKI